MEEKTPIKEIKNFLFNRKVKCGREWFVGDVLENVFHFGLRDIMLNHNTQEANQIIRSIKTFLFKGRK